MGICGLLAVVRYIHRNPLKAGLEEVPGQYPWNSWEAYTTHHKKWARVHTEPVLSRFTGSPRRKQEAFKLFIRGEEKDEIDEMLEDEPSTFALGSDRFTGWLKETFRMARQHDQVPQAPGLSPSVSTIIETVLSHYNVVAGNVEMGRRGTENEPRNMAIYLLRDLRCDTLLTIGAHFGLNHYSSVNSVISRMKVQLKMINSFDNVFKRLPRSFKRVKRSHGRDARYRAPPVQIRTCGTTASGSCLRSDAETLIWVWMNNANSWHPRVDE